MNNTIIGADTSPDEVMDMIRTPREDGKEGLKMAVCSVLTNCIVVSVFFIYIRNMWGLCYCV